MSLERPENLTEEFYQWFKNHGFSVTLAEIVDSKIWAPEYRKHFCLLRKQPYNLMIDRKLFRDNPGRNHYFIEPSIPPTSFDIKVKNQTVMVFADERF